MQIHRELAESLIAKMKALHSTPPVLVPARESDFAHLDMNSYRRFRMELEGKGYRYLGDFENADVSKSVNTVMARTMERSMISADGRTSSGHYQVRPKMEQLAKNLVRGIFNFRFFAAPETFLRHVQTRLCYDFLSEIADTFTGTSNAEAASAFSAPVGLDMTFLPNGTSLEEVRAAHERRLAPAVQRRALLPTVMTSLEDVFAMSDRLRQQKAAHRAASGWITRDELLRLSRGNVELADSIFEEVQLILHRRKSHPS